MPLEVALFYVFGAVAVLAASAMVLLSRSAVASAMSLLLCLVSLAGVSVLLSAHFLAVAQLMVHGGTIAVVLLFVLLLVGVRDGGLGPPRIRHRIAKAVGGVSVLAGTWLAVRELVGHLGEMGPVPEGYGGIDAVGAALYGPFLLPLQLVGLLLLASAVGAVILGRRAD